MDRSSRRALDATAWPTSRSSTQEEGFTIVVGADVAGRLCEVGFVEAADETVVIVHAMPARPKFLR